MTFANPEVRLLPPVAGVDEQTLASGLINMAGYSTPLNTDCGTLTYDEPTHIAHELMYRDPISLYIRFMDESINPVEAGLVHPQKTRAELFEGLESLREKWRALAADNTYIQERVAGWNEKGLIVADFVKFRSMHNPNEDGQIFEKQLRAALLAAIESGQDTEIDLKDMSDWRLRGMLAVLARAASMDEVPQLLFNVWGLPGVNSNNLMEMSIQGSGRPMRPHEMVLKGDNSYDPMCKALEECAKPHDLSIEEYFLQLGVGFQPSIVSNATAKGITELNTEKDFVIWAKGVECHQRLMERNPSVRRLVAAQQTTQTLGHLGIRALKKAKGYVLAA